MLLSLKTAAHTYLACPVPLRRSSATVLPSIPSLVSFSRSPYWSSSTTIKMSSSDSHSNRPNSQIIEHIVLFKVKPDADPSAVDAMISNLNSLISLESVIHLSAGPIARCRSSSLAFTHMLHSRYRSKTDLVAYAEHPEHVSVVSNHVKPVVEDVMAVDWIADDFLGPAVVPPGSSLRLTVMKLKEDAGASGKSVVLMDLKGIKEKFDSVEQLTAGENFTPGRNKGFSICSMAVFKGMMQLEEFDSQTEVSNEKKDKGREFLDGLLVLDYAVVSSVETASL